MGYEVMKHISIQEIDKAIDNIYDNMASIKTNIPMEDKESWCKQVRDETVDGSFQIFKCDNHYVLIEHGFYPVRNEPCILVHNPVCDKCYEATKILAPIRMVNHVGIVTYTENECKMRVEKLG